MATAAPITESARKTKRNLAPAIRKMAIANPELTRPEIARALNCSSQNVHCVLDKFLETKSRAELEDFQSNKADVYDALQFRLLSALTPDKIAKSRTQELVTAAAILEDKARLERGQPTTINLSVMVDAVEAMRTVSERQSLQR